MNEGFLHLREKRGFRAPIRMMSTMEMMRNVLKTAISKISNRMKYPGKSLSTLILFQKNELL